MKLIKKTNNKCYFRGCIKYINKYGVRIKTSKNKGYMYIKNNNNDKYFGKFHITSSEHKLVYKYTGTVIYYNKERYIGSLLNGNKHGNGILFDSDKKIIYNGTWNNNMRHGHGEINIGNYKIHGDINMDKLICGQLFFSKQLYIACNFGVDKFNKLVINKYKISPLLSSIYGIHYMFSNKILWNPCYNLKPNITIIDKNTIEFDIMQALLLVSSNNNSWMELHSLERIENETLYNLYFARNSHIFRLVMDATGKYNRLHHETFGFHGPNNHNNIKHIVNEGFLPSLCNRCKYGNGTYFTINPRHANQYAATETINDEEYKVIIYSRLQFGIPKPGYDNANVKLHSKYDIHNDSFIGMNDNLLIITESTNAYPLYILRYKIHSNGPQGKYISSYRYLETLENETPGYNICKKYGEQIIYDEINKQKFNLKKV